MNEVNIARNYTNIEGGYGGYGGDADYALHELAHFVVLFRRAPRRSKDEIQDMQFVLDDMPCGYAQLHELRVIKLQHIVLGISGKQVLKQVLKQVMWGIHEAASDRKRGQKDVVTSVTKGLRLMREIRVSPRLVQAYRRTIERFSA